MVKNIYLIPCKRFDNRTYIQRRISAAEPELQGALRTTLSFLYLTDGPTNLTRKKLKTCEQYLDDAELILGRWLSTRTTGSERRNYGKDALLAARSQKYRCNDCGRGDVRVLQLHHVEGRKKHGGFLCVCANCHMILSRKQSELVI